MCCFQICEIQCTAVAIQYRCILSFSAGPAGIIIIIIMFVTFVLQTDSTRHVVTRLLLSHSNKSGTCLCSRATRVDHHSCKSTSTPSSRICLPTYSHTMYKLSTSAQHNLYQYGADRQRVKKHDVLQRTGFEPTSIAI